MISTRVFPLAALVAWMTGPPVQAAAQELSVVRSADVTSITDPITIDGALDEPIWASAPKIGNLIQRQPLPGETPTENTEVTLLRDEDNLYIGIRAFDSEADSVIGTVMARDANLNSDDRIEVILDTFRDQRSAFYFATNPAGALVDGLAFANGQLNREWDAIWDVRTSRGRDGWSAEFAIPFKSLSFPSGQDVWGFNVSRTIYRKLEDNRWSGARLQTQFLQVSEAGQIRNLGELTQGIGLDLRPFIAGSWLHLNTGTDDWKRKPGLDVFYNITPSLKLTTTFNTDFGETEVDARQINLTRFSLLFPEKRSFFLEGAGVFAIESTGPDAPGGIPGTGADVYPFFSRQIGLLGGQEVPLDAGVKLIGTIGRTEIGMLDVRTGDLRVGNQLITDERNLFVGRVKRNFFQQSYVGAIFTEGNPQGGTGRTVGADLRLATSRFLGGARNLIINAYGAKSQNGVLSGNDWTYGFSAEYPNDRYLAQFAVREIQENFRPPLGFVQRNNVRMVRAGASFNPRPKNFLNIQQMNHDIFFTQFTRLDLNEIESWDVYVTWLDWHFNSGDSLHAMLDLHPTYERLFEPFEISPGVVLTPGEYRFTRFSSFFSTAAKRRLSGNASIGWGNYWSGKAEQVSASVTYKAPPRFVFSFSSNQTFARLPEGNFTARIFTSNVNYAASPSLSFSNLIRTTTESNNLGWQSRVRWTLQPGSDVFVAFNQGWLQEYQDDRSWRFRVQDTKLSAKFQYSYRF